MWYLFVAIGKSHEVIASYFTICASTIVVIANGNFGLSDITKQSTTTITIKHNNESQGETPVVAKELSNHCYSGSLINQDRIGVDPVMGPREASCCNTLQGKCMELTLLSPGFLRPDSRSLRGTYHTCAQAATVLA